MEKKTAINCGFSTDGLKILKQLCEVEAEKYLEKIDFSKNDTVLIPFWTTDIPELICVGKFYKNEEGVATYTLDFSQTTL